METVGLRELKARLGHYVRLVRAGHTIQVTDRGEIVAELLPPGHTEAKRDTQTGLEELARRGLVRLGLPHDPAVYRQLPRLVPPGTAKRLLDAERGEH